MDDNRLPKEILNYKPEGRRNLGEPLTRWGDDPGGRSIPRGLSLIVNDDTLKKKYLPGPRIISSNFGFRSPIHHLDWTAEKG